MKTLSLGKLGEKLAADFLVGKGYKIIEMNFNKRWGEIDIVAIDPEESFQKTLVFVEVKTRMNTDRISPEESITPWKIKTLKRTALFYKTLHPELPELLRIDFVGLALKSDFSLERINHIKNIS
ncbi:MAG: YraN family protein [Minisyncoccales bacterium]